MPPVLADVEELWIGLNDLKLQMNFEWSDGTPVRFTYWHPFEPNNFRDSLEDCVTIWGPVRPWGWGRILHLHSIPTGTGMGHPGEPGLNLAWEGSSTALGAAAGKEKRMEHGLSWEIPRAVSWAQSCSSSPFPGREVERQPLQPDPALHLQKARPGEPGERRG